MTSTRKLLATLAIVAGLLGLMTASASPANAQIIGLSAGGNIICTGGQPVTGVWVNAGSYSGWASFRYLGRGLYSYSKYLGYVPRYSLAVGCGGSPARWAYTTRTGTLLASVNYYLTCNGPTGRCSGAGLL